MEADVFAANDAFYRAFNDRDIDAMEALWAAGADAWCIHPGWDLLSGRDAVMQSWRAILANPEQPRIVAGGATAFVHGDIAVVTCRELVAGAGLAATNVFVREDGHWRIMHHHSGPVAQVEG